jgi:hypothetical protein
MPRKWLEPIRPWPRLVRNRPYSCRVIDVRKASQGIAVELVHLHEPQVGRRHTLVLPLPLRPEGLGPQFFRACGMVLADGRRIAPKDAAGTVVSVRFDNIKATDPTPVAFAPHSDASSATQEQQNADANE